MTDEKHPTADANHEARILELEARVRALEGVTAMGIDRIAKAFEQVGAPYEFAKLDSKEGFTHADQSGDNRQAGAGNGQRDRTKDTDTVDR
ncbi:hypothetical protein [Ruegeria sp. HKCCA4707]|uniref:hypothetical protein n=1 Tax=Ruegeria sp. HKCCA4707 TaxID=2682984 RepID=UPI00148998BE|nr:hypothetical protein [Ruegeria sp. HKCCA4707]